MVDEQTRILVAEDERMVADVVVRYLERDGHAVMHAADGAQAVEMAEEYAPDLVILDLMLPKVDGLQVFRQIRSIAPVPIIFVTARGQETERILGLELGADDYVTKPFSPRELVARVRAVLRRSEPLREMHRQHIDVGPIRIDPSTRHVSVRDQPIELTAREFDLLLFMARHPKQVFSRDQLLSSVWNSHYYGDASTVTVHIHRLRSKIEPDPLRPVHLRTVWGVGYKFEG